MSCLFHWLIRKKTIDQRHRRQSENPDESIEKTLCSPDANIYALYHKESDILDCAASKLPSRQEGHHQASFSQTFDLVICRSMEVERARPGTGRHINKRLPIPNFSPLTSNKGLALADEEKVDQGALLTLTETSG